MERTTKILAVLVVLIVVGSSVGLYFYNENQKVETVVLTVAVDPDNTNYEYYYGSTNQLAGIDIDLMYAVCQELGYKFNPIVVPFNQILDGVADRSYDVGASTFTITEERKKTVDFTSQYDQSGLVVITKNSKNYTSQSDLYTARIAVQAGTVADTFVTNTDGFNKNNILRCMNSAATITAVTNNYADCAILDQVNAESISLKSSGLKVLNILDYSEIQFFGFAVSKDNPDLLNKINSALEKIRADGRLAEIKIYYSDSYCTKMPYYLSTK